MRNSLCKKICGGFAWVVSVAFASIVVMACSSSDDKSVAGGTTEDAGIVAIKNLDVAGVTQKGPFVKGSAVTVQGIDCKTLQLTDELFEGSVKSDKGDFTVKNVSLKSTCALFEVTGVYRSEITGKKSSKELTLRALTDLKDRENVNINVLTELEYERLLHLVTEKGKTFAEAKSQAEQEVLAAFDIAGSFEEFENLNIFESGDGNAALLAVSVMMQVKTDDAGLVKRMNEFVDSFAETGMWKDSSAKATIADWAADAIAGNGLDSIRKNIEAWDIGDTVAAFEKFIAAEFPDTVILSSDSQSSSSATLSEVEGSSSSEVTADTTSSSSSVQNSLDTLISSSSSEVYLDWSIPKEAYLNPNITYGEMTDARDGQIYKTVKIGNRTWMAQNLNYADSAITPSIVGQSWCFDDDPEKCKVAGRLYTWNVAVDVCPDGWHLPTKAELDTLISLRERVLKSQVGWADKNGVDAVGFSIIPAGIRTSSDSIFGGDGSYAFFWTASEKTDSLAYGLIMDDNSDMLEFDTGEGFSVRCVNDEIDGATYPIWSVLSKEVFFNPEIKYDSIVDIRDGQIYKTVRIGKQVWMAENLNYSDSARTPSLLNRSWCFENDSANCKLAGRLYTWAAAIDSVTLARNSTHPLDCGYKKACGLDSAVQGICPEEWHLPTRAEWRALFNEIGADSVVKGSSGGTWLKSQVGWYANGNANGSDDYGFSVISAGIRTVEGDYRNKGASTWFWSASEASSVDAHYIEFTSNNSIHLFDDTKFYGCSIRCVKD